MALEIDYFFVGASPFTYFGHGAIEGLALKHGVKLNYKPVNLMRVWEISGAVPPAQRPPVRQRYRLLELQRIADLRGMPVNLKPTHFPVDVTLADSCVIAILESGGNPSAYMASVFAGVWAREENIADEAVIGRKLSENGFDAASIIQSAQGEAVKRIREANTVEAIEKDAVGVPAYVLNGEVFWGQDRIDYIDHALASGRKPFRADAV